MAANKIRGLELWARLATAINEETLNDGGILDKNNHRLWRGYFHKWTNQEWLDILSAVADVQDAEPTLFRKDQERALARALNTIVDQHMTNGRCLDTKANKHTQWHMAMVLRELWNAASQQPAPDIFTIED
jgi:hypothetical protein